MVYWDSDDREHMTVLDALDRGDRVWITGTLQLQLRSAGGAGESKLVVVANHIQATEADALNAIEAMVPQA